MKKYLVLLLAGLLVLATLTACGDDPSESAWYEDWLGSKSEETTTEPEETTTEPEETTTEPEETTTEPEETTTEPEETTTEPEETTTEPEETTTEPEESTTEDDWSDDWSDDWNDDWSDDGNDYDPPAETTTEPEDTTTEPEDTTTEPEKYTITYVLNGGSFSSEEVVDQFTSEEAVTLPIPTKTDLIFAGWYENKNFAGNAVTEIPVGTVGDKTFYAKWKVEGITFPTIPMPPFDDVE